jgi:lysophospholipase L1-like esterase
MGVFVALGDSITLGIGDPAPAGSRDAGTGGRARGGRAREGADAWRGWAALLAGSLPGVTLQNLAVSGALSRDVERNQLPRALELRPDLAAVIVGVNDTLRYDFDPHGVADALAHTIGALRATGALVLTMRLPDAGRMFGLPGVLARPLARRMAAVNEVIEELAQRFGTVHFDAAAHPSTYDRRMWSVDRLHPSERGHRFVAGEFFDRLARRGYPVGERPGAEPTSPAPTRRAQLAWMATKGTRWVVDRSTDLIPGLLLLAAREAMGRPAEPDPPRRGSPPGAARADTPMAGPAGDPPWAVADSAAPGGGCGN